MTDTDEVKAVKIPAAEIPAAVGRLIASLIGVDLGEQDDADEHDATKCNCGLCHMRRFQVPTHDVSHHEDNIIEAMKTVARIGHSTANSIKKWNYTLILTPLTPEAEDVVLQMLADRLQSVVRTLRALDAMLPRERRAPAEIIPPMYSLEELRGDLQKGRALTQEKLNAKKAERNAQDIAREAVNEAVANG